MTVSCPRRALLGAALSLPLLAVAQAWPSTATSRPGQLNHASSGNGTIVHLTSKAFEAQAGVSITHIPYRGTALAITSRTRSALVPELPTVAESGLPADITARLIGELNAAMKSAEVADRLARLGAEPAAANTPAQFAALVVADAARWATLIKDRHITAE